jgi:hypothetical protein
MFLLDDTPYGRAFVDQMGFLVTPEQLWEALQESMGTYLNSSFVDYARRYNSQRMWDCNQVDGPPPYPELSSNPDKLRSRNGAKSKPERVKRSGFVYLMQAENGEYKIGLSQNPPARALQLELNIGFRMTIIHAIPSDDMQIDERNLLNTYSDKCIHGEWFALTPADVDHICSLTETDLREARDD